MRSSPGFRRRLPVLLLPTFLVAAVLLALLYFNAMSVGSGINRYGESYGLSAEDSDPDLIAAVGLFNVRGYVKKSDLDSVGQQPESPEEAASLRHEDAVIPLYLSDGRTVIGAFPFTK